MSPLSLETADRTVGGVQFRFTMLPANEGRKVQILLLRAIGPALGAFIGLKDDDDEDAIDPEALGALGTAIENLKEDEVTAIQNLLARSSQVNIEGGWHQVSDVFELFFAGKMRLMWMWTMAGVKFNLGDFLGESQQ